MTDSGASSAANQASSLLRAAAAKLAHTGVPSPSADATLLLAHAWGHTAAEVRRLSIVGATVPIDVVQRYDALIGERARRVPLQHLTGVAYFRQLELAVGPGVFVPRPETELLVDLVLGACSHIAEPTVVDLCTGSGAIAFAIKQERPDARVAAVELGGDAFAWAQQNRQRLGLEVDLRQGRAQDAFADLTGEVDVIASNPPYVPDGMVPVDPEVRDHDPSLALFGGSEDGLRIPLEVAARAAQLLRPGGTLVMEHAETQGNSLPHRLQSSGTWSQVRDVVDLTGRPRHTVAVRADRG